MTDFVFCHNISKYNPTWEAHLHLCIPLQAARTVDDVHQVDGSPSKGHAITAQTLAELVWLAAKLLQFLFILSKHHKHWLLQNINQTMTLTSHKLQFKILWQHLTLWRPCRVQHTRQYHLVVGPSPAVEKTYTTFNILYYTITNYFLQKVYFMSCFIWQMNTVRYLDHQENILGWVGDRKYGWAGQSGDGGCLNVWPQHGLRLLRV